MLAEADVEVRRVQARVLIESAGKELGLNSLGDWTTDAPIHGDLGFYDQHAGPLSSLRRSLLRFCRPKWQVSPRHEERSKLCDTASFGSQVVCHPGCCTRRREGDEASERE